MLLLVCCFCCMVYSNDYGRSELFFFVKHVRAFDDSVGFWSSESFLRARSPISFPATNDVRPIQSSNENFDHQGVTSGSSVFFSFSFRSSPTSPTQTNIIKTTSRAPPHTMMASQQVPPPRLRWWRGPLLLVPVMVSLLVPYFKHANLYQLAWGICQFVLITMASVLFLCDIKTLLQTYIQKALDRIRITARQTDKIVLDDVLQSIFDPTQGWIACGVTTWMGAMLLHGLPLTEQHKIQLIQWGLNVPADKAHRILMQPGGYTQLLPERLQQWLKPEAPTHDATNLCGSNKHLEDDHGSEGSSSSSSSQEDCNDSVEQTQSAGIHLASPESSTASFMLSDSPVMMMLSNRNNSAIEGGRRLRRRRSPISQQHQQQQQQQQKLPRRPPVTVLVEDVPLLQHESDATLPQTPRHQPHQNQEHRPLDPGALVLSLLRDTIQSTFLKHLQSIPTEPVATAGTVAGMVLVTQLLTSARARRMVAQVMEGSLLFGGLSICASSVAILAAKSSGTIVSNTHQEDRQQTVKHIIQKVCQNVCKGATTHWRGVLAALVMIYVSRRRKRLLLETRQTRLSP